MITKENVITVIFRYLEAVIYILYKMVVKFLKKLSVPLFNGSVKSSLHCNSEILN